jgi:hypothetical protein
VNCRSLEKWVWQEGVGNLPAAAVEHASGCPECRTLIEQVRLLDRSVGATVVPDPSAEYWDAMAERIARRITDPTDQVIELAPVVPAWRRLLVHAWAPTMAVALLAVIASQDVSIPPTRYAFDESELKEKVADLSTPRESSRVESEKFAVAARSENQTPTQKAAAGISDLSPTADGLSSRNALRDPDANLARTSEQSSRATMPDLEQTPTIAAVGQSSAESTDQVWPDRQVTIMGAVDSNAPAKSASDDKRMAAQDPFGAYERQMAQTDPGLESAGTFASPGRLLDGPASSQSRGSERLTPAEQMRRFDEIAELRQLIARMEEIPETSRAMSQWTQWSTAWYRLGMLSDQRAVIDSAITAVEFFSRSVTVDEATSVEWQARKTNLEIRRSTLEP